MQNLPVRRSIRLPAFDYRSAAAYFVTICARVRGDRLGTVADGVVCLNSTGAVVEHCWCCIPQHFVHVALDLHIVMPDHVHGIIVIEHAPAPTAGGHGGCHASALIPGALGTVVRSFKAAATAHTRAMRSNTESPLWQRGYYEHVVRNDRDLDRIRQYIDENPLRWHLRRQANAVTP